MQFVEQTRKQLFFTNIMNKLEFLESTAQKYTLQNKEIKDQLVILKNAPRMEEFIQKLFFWALLLYNAAVLSNLTHKAPTYNKNIKS